MKKDEFYVDEFLLGNGILLETTTFRQEEHGEPLRSNLQKGVVLTIKYKTLIYHSLADEDYWVQREIHQTLEQAKQKILKDTSIGYYTDNEIVDFVIDPIGREFSQTEQQEIEVLRSQYANIRKELHRKQNEKYIQALEEQLKYLRRSF